MIWKKIHICYHPCWLYLNLSVLCDIYCEGSRNAHSMQNTGTTWYSYTDNDILCLVNLFLPSSKSNIQFCLFDHYRAPRWLLKKIIYDRHWFSLLNGSEQLRTYDCIQRAFFVCLLVIACPSVALCWIFLHENCSTNAVRNSMWVKWYPHLAHCKLECQLFTLGIIMDFLEWRTH